MGGLGNVFKRILPIIMIICFICLGITYVFNRNENKQLTYLTHETINSEITDTEITYYKLDTNTYMSNLSSSTLEKSLSLENSFEKYQQVIEKFTTIWSNGYQFGDVSKTIANAVILVIDTILLPINIVIIPIRISMAILLTILSLIGINISLETGLIAFIKTLATKLELPLITLYTKSDNQNETSVSILSWQKWILYDSPTITGNEQINFTFYDSNYIEYKAIKTEVTPVTISNPLYNKKMYFQDTNDQWILVYEKNGFTGGYTNESYKQIWIGENSNFTNLDWYNLYFDLQNLATTPINPYDKTQEDLDNLPINRNYILRKKEYTFC